LPAGSFAEVDSLAVYANGRRALAQVGAFEDVGERPMLVDLDLTTSPATVLGRNTKVRPLDLDPMVIRGNATAYVATESVVKVMNVRPDRPTVLATVHVGNPFEIDALALRPDGRVLYVAAGNFLGHDHVYAVPLNRRGRPGKPVLVLTGSVSGLAFTPNGHHLVASMGSRLRVFDVRHADRAPRVASFKSGVEAPLTPVVAPDGRTAYVGDDLSGTVAHVDLSTGAVLQRRVGNSHDSITAIGLSPRGSRLVVLEGERGTHRPSVLVLDETLKPKQRLTGPCDPTAVAVSTAGPTRGSFYVGDSGGVCHRPPKLFPFSR
jgi:DNA-binding beta-propeller fold protein YncE